MRTSSIRRIAMSPLVPLLLFTAACSGNAPDEPSDATSSPVAAVKGDYVRAPRHRAPATTGAMMQPHDTTTITQGLPSYTLVAGKKFAIRGWLDAAPSIVRAQVSIVGPDGGRHFVQVTNLGQIPAGNGQASVVAVVPGVNVTSTGFYWMQTTFYDAANDAVATFVNDDVFFDRTKDLRLFVDRVWSGTADPKPNEVQAAIDAVNRMAEVMPVRDGAGSLAGTGGIRYYFNNDPQPSDSDIAGLFTKARQGFFGEPCDTAMTYRFANPGEGWGASTQPTENGMPWALAVWGDPQHPSLAETFTHETGHLFGLVAPTAPDWDGKQGHSKWETIQNGEELLGVNVGYDRAWNSPLHDLMFWEGNEANDAFAFNALDWEYERNSLLALPSSGPSVPQVLQPAPGAPGGLQGTTALVLGAAGGNGDDFAVAQNGALWHRDDVHGWTSLNGNVVPGSVRVGSEADGRLIVFTEQTNRSIFFQIQNGVGGTWPGVWTQLTSTPARGLDVASNQDGHLEIQWVGDDGVLHTIWQLGPNGPFSAPASLDGTRLAGPIALGRNADGRLQSFVLGGDGAIYSRSEPYPNTGPWTGWTNIGGYATNASLLGVTALPDGRLTLVAMRSDGTALVSTQLAPSGAFAGWTTLDTFGAIRDFTLAASNDGRLHLFVLDAQGHLWQNFQVDTTRPTVWSGWWEPSDQAFVPGIAVRSIEPGTSPGVLDVRAVGTAGNYFSGLL